MMTASRAGMRARSQKVTVAMSDLMTLEQTIISQIAAASDEAALEAVRVAALGKKGSISALLATLGKMSPDERKTQGAAINLAKDTVNQALTARRDILKSAALDARLASETIDVTLPLRETPAEQGRIHPLSQVMDELTAIFADMGFAIAEGPDIESDATHTPQFHQVEGLVIDRGSHLGHLKWILHEFCKAFFEVDHINMRFRPSFFPFTEPSLEVDIQCRRDQGEIRFGEGEDWLEILGCGMVHPNVLRACGIDPDIYQGFAWGMGIDRIAMLKYGMSDLRQLFESDVRWLAHYGFKPLDVPALAGGLSS